MHGMMHGIMHGMMPGIMHGMMHGNIPYMFDRWAHPVVQLLLLKSSTAKLKSTRLSLEVSLPTY